MRAVNLIPGDARRTSAGPRSIPRGPGVALIGVLAVAVGFLTFYVLTANTISQRKAQVVQLQAQVAQQQALVTKLGNYAQFAKLAQARVETIRQIVATRFDWHSALSDLSKVVPANTSLQSLSASVAPGSVGGSSGTDALRATSSAPAFELTGCTRTQDDVARLISRLRLINGVTRVTLGDTQKQSGPGAAATVSTSTASTGATGCGSNAPTFDLVVFFAPLPSAGPSAAGSTPSAPAPAQATATPVHAQTSTGGSK